MKPLLLLCLVTLFVFACKKDKTAADNPFAGIWVETSQRLDTIDLVNVPSDKDSYGNSYFTLRSAAYTPPASAFYLQPHSQPFAYRLDTNRISVLAAYSATLNFPIYDFKWGTDKKSFTVGRFYVRNTLPNPIVFERIK